MKNGCVDVAVELNPSLSVYISNVVFKHQYIKHLKAERLKNLNLNNPYIPNKHKNILEPPKICLTRTCKIVQTFSKIRNPGNSDGTWYRVDLYQLLIK